MSSAAVPAFLLARRVSRSVWAASLVAVLTVVVPWIVLSSFLLTEVAAYPGVRVGAARIPAGDRRAFARNDASPQRCSSSRSSRGRSSSCSLARCPLAILLDGARCRALRAHRVLAPRLRGRSGRRARVTAAGHSVLGTYSATAHGNPVPLGIVPAFAEHLATIALGLGIVPFLVGGAWLAANAVRAATREQRFRGARDRWRSCCSRSRSRRTTFGSAAGSYASVTSSTSPR